MPLQYAYLLDPNLLVEGVSLRLIGLIWPQASPNTARGGRQDPASHAAHTRAEGWVLITNTADSVFVVQAAAVLQEAEDWDTYHEVDVIIVTSRIWGVGPSWGAQMPHFPGGEWSGVTRPASAARIESSFPMIVQGYWWELQTGLYQSYQSSCTPSHCCCVTSPASDASPAPGTLVYNAMLL